MLGWVYRNLSEEQPSIGSALQNEKTRAVASAGFCLDQPFSTACTNGGVTSTPVCSAAV